MGTRTIDSSDGYRYPFPAFPDGWFSIGSSDSIAVGDVKPLRYLGRELVAFRGEDGTARVFDAHCPHLGAHVGFGGYVCGDGVVCPFHGWCFDGDGQLTDVPGLDRRPPRVAMDAWDVCERNGQIHIWHHAKGEPPSYEVTPYRENGKEWTDWRTGSFTVRIGLQDLTENILDRSHFLHVHDMVEPDEPHFEVTFDGPSMTVDQHMKVTAVDEQGFSIRSVTTTCGPGIVAVVVQEAGLDMLTYITQTPIDDQRIEINLNFSMVSLDNPEASDAIAKMNSDVTNDQFTRDVPIWENKVYRAKPPLTKVDGPVSQYRRWFRQFYSDWEPESTATMTHHEEPQDA